MTGPQTLKAIVKGEQPRDMSPAEQLQALKGQIDGMQGELQRVLGPRVSAAANESSWSLPATFSQFSVEKRKRQESKPRVITIFFPSAFAKDFGSETRFLSSSVCSYSPMSIVMKSSRYQECEGSVRIERSARRTRKTMRAVRDVYGERRIPKCNEAMCRL